MLVEMQEIDINTIDRKIIRSDIWVSMFLGTLFLLAIIGLVALIFFIGVLLKANPSTGVVDRVMYFLVGILILYIALLYPNFIKLIDLIKGKKVILNLSSYTIDNIKDIHYVVSSDKKYGKIEIYDDLVPEIKKDLPLQIEVSKYSKIVLYISNDKENLLERIEC
jgi:hypothetical protein